MHSIKLFATTFLTSFFFSFIISAQTTAWNGAMDDNWAEAMNWDNGVPTASLDAEVDLNNSVVTIYAGTNAVAKSLNIFAKDVSMSIKSNATLTIDGSSGDGWNIESGGSLTNKIVNEGKVDILNALGNSISNQDSFINHGTIYALDNSAHGILNTGYFLNELNGEMDIENPVVYGFLNLGLLENHGLLNTKNAGSSGYGDNNIIESKFMNYGCFQDSSSYFGIFSYGEISNHGKMVFSSQEQDAIRARGKFENFDSILIAHVFRSGIVISDTFYNHIDGNIVIDSTTTDNAIDSRFGHLINDGEMDIERTELGLVSKDLHNSSTGKISVSQTSSYGMWSQGHMVNEGEIEISWTESAGMNNTGNLVNEGVIEISNAQSNGMYTNDSLTNSGTITISEVLIHGIQNDGAFINFPTGIFTINNTNNSSSDIYAFLNQSNGIIENKGNITITDSETYGLRNEGLFHNYRDLYISVTNRAALWNLNTLYNYENSYIQLSNITAPNGIFNSTGKMIRNDGTITINEVTGIGVRNFGTISIGSTGILSSQNIDGDFWINDPGAILDCAGLMDIK